jgi:hypothetical protein
MSLWATPARAGTTKYPNVLGNFLSVMGSAVRQRDGSWLALLIFFVVATLASSLGLAALLAGVTVAVAGGESPQISEDQQVDPSLPGRIYSGFITDRHCGARHTDSKDNPAECARMCVRKGSRYIIVEGDRSYELTGSPGQFGKFAGQRVSLTGVLNGNTIKVSSASLQVASNQR